MAEGEPTVDTDEVGRNGNLKVLLALAEFALGPEPACVDIDPATVDQELRKAKIDPGAAVGPLHAMLADAKAKEDRAKAGLRRERLLQRAASGITARRDGRAPGQHHAVQRYYRGLEGAPEADVKSVTEDEALLDLVLEEEDGIGPVHPS